MGPDESSFGLIPNIETFHDNPSNNCRDTSPKSYNMISPWHRRKGPWDSSSGDLEHLYQISCLFIRYLRRYFSPDHGGGPSDWQTFAGVAKIQPTHSWHLYRWYIGCLLGLFKYVGVQKCQTTSLGLFHPSVYTDKVANKCKLKPKVFFFIRVL